VHKIKYGIRFIYHTMQRTSIYNYIYRQPEHLKRRKLIGIPPHRTIAYTKQICTYTHTRHTMSHLPDQQLPSWKKTHNMQYISRLYCCTCHRHVFYRSLAHITASFCYIVCSIIVPTNSQVDRSDNGCRHSIAHVRSVIMLSHQSLPSGRAYPKLNPLTGTY